MTKNRRNKEDDCVHVRRYKEVDGFVEMDFMELGHLIYHDLILTILKDYLQCEVVDYNDLITDIKSKLRWNGIEFDFNHHYVFGNLIIAPPEHADALEQLANQVADVINEKVSKGKKGKKTPRT